MVSATRLQPVANFIRHAMSKPVLVADLAPRKKFESKVWIVLDSNREIVGVRLTKKAGVDLQALVPGSLLRKFAATK